MPRQPRKSRPKPPKGRKGEKATVVLLSGGNPQIAQADGDAPVQAYIAAMPGWKRDLGKRLDALIVHEDDQLDEAQMESWVMQAAALPGFLAPRS